MTQEDKELLLRDLCARLPYSLCVQDEYGEIDYVNYNDVHFANYFDSILNGKVKPYLRPMSSMTEEEAKELSILCDITDVLSIKIILIIADSSKRDLQMKHLKKCII